MRRSKKIYNKTNQPTRNPENWIGALLLIFLLFYSTLCILLYPILSFFPSCLSFFSLLRLAGIISLHSYFLQLIHISFLFTHEIDIPSNRAVSYLKESMNNNHAEPQILELVERKEPKEILLPPSAPLLPDWTFASGPSHCLLICALLNSPRSNWVQHILTWLKYVHLCFLCSLYRSAVLTQGTSQCIFI